jgi:ATP-dependent RNA helicase DDX24/MAK5
MFDECLLYRYLVIDEADRMMEKGHFQELQELLDRMHTQGNKKSRPQTLVFSATLTMVHEPPARLHHKVGKKKPKRQTPGQKLQELISLLGMEKPKVKYYVAFAFYFVIIVLCITGY